MQLYLHDHKFIQYCQELLVLQKYKINKGKKKETKNICSIGFQLYTNAADRETDFVV